MRLIKSAAKEQVVPSEGLIKRLSMYRSQFMKILNQKRSSHLLFINVDDGSGEIKVYYAAC